ncbi:hypothetical protein AGMMS50267_02490 [Spirochaetia bacterium]|nr:hypothetical protein AGMMS50267_02490 [Spirochaetia bacterium]
MPNWQMVYSPLASFLSLPLMGYDTLVEYTSLFPLHRQYRRFPPISRKSHALNQLKLREDSIIRLLRDT